MLKEVSDPLRIFIDNQVCLRSRDTLLSLVASFRFLFPWKLQA